MKVIKIEWVDSCVSDTNWQLLKDFDVDIDPIYINTYGVVVKENDDYIVVAQSYGTNPAQICSTISIPKGCIKKITEIEEI